MKVLFSKERIASEVARLGRELTLDYADKDLVVIGVLKGSFIFLADLVREIDLEFDVDFVRLASYGSETLSSGVVEMRKDKEIPIRGRDVLIVEDIVDSGNSLSYLCARFELEKPASLKICTLIDKKGRREISVDADYIGISMEDSFIVGYGLDLNEKYRNLPAIYDYESK